MVETTDQQRQLTRHVLYMCWIKAMPLRPKYNPWPCQYHFQPSRNNFLTPKCTGIQVIARKLFQRNFQRWLSRTSAMGRAISPAPSFVLPMLSVHAVSTQYIGNDATGSEQLGQSRLSALHWLPVKQRVTYKMATLTFKVLYHRRQHTCTT